MERPWSVPIISALVALLAVVLVAPGQGPAEGAIPNKGGTFSACLTKSTGAVRIINYPKVKCAKGQRLIRWNAKGQAGAQGAQGVQGPAGPADWNAIGNKPAGFADGVDDVGYVSATQPGTYSAGLGGGPVAILVDHPVGTDVALEVIPEPGTNLEVAEEFYEREPDGTLRYRLEVVNSDFADPVAFKVRTRVYNTGIAPAAFKKALKRVDVTVTKARKRGK